MTAATTASFDLIVLGSSLAGWAATVAAARRGQRVLLIEAGTIAGHDFVETLQAQYGWNLPAGADDLAQELHAAATERKIIAGDRCDLAAFSCLLQDFLAKCGATALYMTDLTAVQSAKTGGFAVTVSNRSGIETFHAERLMDATLEAVSLRALNRISDEPAVDSWAFRGLMIGVDLPAAEKATAPVPEITGVELTATAGRYPADVIVEMRGTGAAPNIGAARVEFLNRVMQLRTQAAWKAYTVATVANLVAATPKITVAAQELEKLEATGWTAVAAWRQAALATAPWAAVQAGVGASVGQLTAAK